MHGLNGMGWGMGTGWIFGLLVLAAIIWFITRVVNTNQGQPASPHNSALAILDERYARGEISKEEYEDIKRNLVNS